MRDKARRLRSRLIWHRKRGHRAYKLERAYKRAKAAWLRAKRPYSSRRWGGCRAVTDEVIAIVAGRAGVTSRKRTQTYGNPGSDHHVSQKNADAVDFGIANAYWLAREIAADLGAPGGWSGDYDNFHIRRNGGLFRVQLIAGTHGTGPHLHCGVRRAG